MEMNGDDIGRFSCITGYSCVELSTQHLFILCLTRLLGTAAGSKNLDGVKNLEIDKNNENMEKIWLLGAPIQ